MCTTHTHVKFGVYRKYLTELYNRTTRFYAKRNFLILFRSLRPLRSNWRTYFHTLCPSSNHGNRSSYASNFYVIRAYYYCTFESENQRKLRHKHENRKLIFWNLYLRLSDIPAMGITNSTVLFREIWSVFNFKSIFWYEFVFIRRHFFFRSGGLFIL